MDTPALLGAALAFSVVALPLIFVLFTKNIAKDIELSEAKIRKECTADSVKLRADFTAELVRFRSSLNLDHKKLAYDNLEKISKRLTSAANKLDPKGKIYENWDDN